MDIEIDIKRSLSTAAGTSRQRRLNLPPARRASFAAFIGHRHT